MNNGYDKYLEQMKDKFIKEGYFNNGAVSARSIKNRKVINKLLDNGLIVKRNCELESYELSEAIRAELIKDYNLHKLWGDQYRIFEVRNLKCNE